MAERKKAHPEGACQPRKMRSEEAESGVIKRRVDKLWGAFWVRKRRVDKLWRAFCLGERCEWKPKGWLAVRVAAHGLWCSRLFVC